MHLPLLYIAQHRATPLKLVLKQFVGLSRSHVEGCHVLVYVDHLINDLIISGLHDTCEVDDY